MKFDQKCFHGLRLLLSIYLLSADAKLKPVTGVVKVGELLMTPIGAGSDILFVYTNKIERKLYTTIVLGHGEINFCGNMIKTKIRDCNLHLIS